MSRRQVALSGGRPLDRRASCVVSHNVGVVSALRPFLAEQPPLPRIAMWPAYRWLVVGTVCVGAFLGAGRQHRRAGAADATTGLRGADRQRRVGFHRLSADAGGARRATRAIGGPARSQDALLVGLRRLHRRLRIVRSGPYPGVADHLPRGAGRGCGYAAGQQRRHHHGCRAPPRAWSRHRRPGRRPGRRTLNRTVSWWSPHRYAGLAVGVLHRRAGRHRGNRVGPRGAAVHHSRSGGGGRF